MLMPTFEKRPLIVKKSALVFEEEECHRLGASAARATEDPFGTPGSSLRGRKESRYLSCQNES
jgi:hypothetical protein